MRYIFDSSFILSLILPSDTNHEIAVNQYRKIDEEAIFYMGELTYVETLTVATYKLGIKESKKLQELLEDMGTTFLHSGVMEYVNFYNFLGKKISVTDASIIYDSMRYDLDILSFDKELLWIYRHIQS